MDIKLPWKISASAYNGKDALELLSLHKPDLVITDIRMPVMDGIKLIENIKNTSPNMPIVILSGYSDFHYAQQAIKIDVNDFFPFVKSFLKP